MEKNIHVRDFDGKLYDILVKRAAARGLSLSEYLRIELARMARTPTLDDVLEKMAKQPRPKVSAEDVQRAWAEARAERDDADNHLGGFAEEPRRKP